jgi:hypothetical protein
METALRGTSVARGAGCRLLGQPGQGKPKTRVRAPGAITRIAGNYNLRRTVRSPSLSLPLVTGSRRVQPKVPRNSRNIRNVEAEPSPYALHT